MCAAHDSLSRCRPCRVRGASAAYIAVLKDPCGTQTAGRSAFLHYQFDVQALGRLYGALFRTYDGTLHWGLGQTIAFVGGGARHGSTTKLSQRGGGGAAEDEPLMHNPAWDARLSGGARKLAGSKSWVDFPNASSSRAARMSPCGL